MLSLGEKIRTSRRSADMSQTELANLAGVSVRSVIGYEKDEKHPRQGTLFLIAKALKVSIKYLSDSSCNDPKEDIEKDQYIVDADEKFGSSGVRDINSMLEENLALFAGGELSQAEKDIYFEAIMTAYVTCKEKAKEKFGRK